MPGLLTIVITIRIDGQQELSFGNRGDAEGSPRLRPTHWNVRRAAFGAPLFLCSYVPHSQL
jgi:hypothetical protein